MTAFLLGAGEFLMLMSILLTPPAVIYVIAEIVAEWRYRNNRF